MSQAVWFEANLFPSGIQFSIFKMGMMSTVFLVNHSGFATYLL